MTNIDFTINQIQIRYDWQEVIGEEVTTSTFLGFCTYETTKSIFKNSYRILDAESKEVIETNTDSLPPPYCASPRITFKYSSEGMPSNIEDIFAHMNIGVGSYGKPMPKLTIDRPTCTLQGVFITEWNPKIKGGTGVIDYISYK